MYVCISIYLSIDRDRDINKDRDIDRDIYMWFCLATDSVDTFKDQ